LAGQQLQRIAASLRSVARFGRRNEGKNGIQSLGRQRLAVELRLARGRREPAVSEGQERSGLRSTLCLRVSVVEVQANVPLALQARAINAGQPGMRNVEHG